MTTEVDPTPKPSLVRRVATTVGPAFDSNATPAAKRRGIAAIVGTIAAGGVGTAAGVEGLTQVVFKDPHMIVDGLNYLGPGMYFTGGVTLFGTAMCSLSTGSDNFTVDGRTSLRNGLGRVRTASLMVTSGLAVLAGATLVGGELGVPGLMGAGHAVVDTAAAFGAIGLVTGIGARAWSSGLPKTPPQQQQLGE